MEYLFIIIAFVFVALVTALAVAYSLRRQRDAAMQEVAMIARRLTDIERKLEENEKTLVSAKRPGRQEDENARRQEDENAGRQEDEDTGRQEDENAGKQGDADTGIQGDADTGTQEDLSAMTDEELFRYITKVIKEQELYRWPDFNRSAVMQHFSLSAARVGAAFAQGGGQSLPEFVRNCRLDHACRLIVEHPTMSFVEVGEASGYQRTTTFYHDFKARFGMAPAEYRKLKMDNG